MNLSDVTWIFCITTHRINDDFHRKVVYEWDAYTNMDKIQMSIRSSEHFETKETAKSDFLSFRRKHKLKYKTDEWSE